MDTYEWLDQCAARFKRAHPALTNDECDSLAAHCFRPDEDPENCADDEMSEW